jgi:cytochrome c oxidase subunit 4
MAETEVVETGTDVVPADSTKGEVVTQSVQSSPAHEHGDHPDARQYVLIAVVLVILTGIEVATSYLEGHVNSNILITALALMAATKFFLVAAWFMHMKMDAPLFRRLFVIGIVGASCVYGIVLLVFSSTALKR